MKGVILHGGNGTRLRPLTYTDVKQLLPVAGKPISEYALENLKEIGIRDINIVVGEVGAREVKEYYLDGKKWGLNITYTYQERAFGIAQAIGLTEEFVGKDDFVVILGDNYFQAGLTGLARMFDDRSNQALIALTKVDEPSQFGVATLNNGKVVKLEEKPKNSESHLAITGVYFLRNSIFELIRELKPSQRNELEITEAFQLMLDKNMHLGYAVIEGWWKDTGTVEEFLDCNRMVLDNTIRSVPQGSPLGSIMGRANITSGVRLLGTSRILGPCYIGRNTVIENCYIGPYSSIGAECVLKNVEIEDSVVMDGSKIEILNGTRIIQSMVGPNTVISSSSKGKNLRLIIGRDSRIEL